MHTRFVTGFTLLELLITVAVGAIVLGLGVPMMGSLLAANRVAGQVNALRGALALTRSEAIRRNTQVVLCKSADGKHCGRKQAWSRGWMVYVDRNENHTREEKEPVVLVHGALSKGHTLNYRGFGSHNYIVYRPTGYTQMNGTFEICATNAPDFSKALILMKTGRVRLSKTRPDGSSLKCKNAVNS
jgi:type IV fimbrial biogenesis protein FimT